MNLVSSARKTLHIFQVVWHVTRGISSSLPHVVYYCKLGMVVFLIFMEMLWLRIKSFLWVPLGKRDGSAGWGLIRTFSVTTQKIEKNDYIYLHRVSFTFGKDDGLTDTGIEVSSSGAFIRRIFLLLGKTSAFIHTSGLMQGLVSDEEETVGLKRHFSSSNFSAYLASSIFGTEYSDSCLIISFILWICQHSTNIYLTPAMC